MPQVNAGQHDFLTAPVDQASDLIRAVPGVTYAAIGNRIQDTVAALGSRLPETVGVGPVIAGRLLGRTGRASRFPPPAHLASDTGAAPVEVASGERARHRLSRAGDRQRNHALHIIALVQIALVQVGTPGWAGDHDFRRKLAEGKTTREAMRRRKRRVADHVWRVTLSDEQARNHHQPQTADRQRRPRLGVVNGKQMAAGSSGDRHTPSKHFPPVSRSGRGVAPCC